MPEIIFPPKSIALYAKLLVEGSPIFTPYALLQQSTRQQRHAAKKEIIFNRTAPVSSFRGFTSEEIAATLALAEKTRPTEVSRAAYLPYTGISRRRKASLAELPVTTKKPQKAIQTHEIDELPDSILGKARSFLMDCGFDSKINVLIGNPLHKGNAVRNWEKLLTLSAQNRRIGMQECIELPRDSALGRARGHAESAILLYQIGHAMKDAGIGLGLSLLVPGSLGGIVIFAAFTKAAVHLFAAFKDLFLNDIPGNFTENTPLE